MNRYLIGKIVEQLLRKENVKWLLVAILGVLVAARPDAALLLHSALTEALGALLPGGQ